MGRTFTWILGATLALASTLAACKGPEPIMRVAPRSVGVRGHGAMTPLVASGMGEKLTRIGLDPKHLPPLEQITDAQKLAVMETFSEALGVNCAGCHAQDDMRADTRRKRIAKRMWNDFTRGITFENGDALYCDSCHQGHLFNLNRNDKAKLSDYMSDQFVGRLKRVDGKDHDCGTCHGDPPEFAFLSLWRESPAPDIRIVKAPPPPAPTAIAIAPTPSATSTAAPVPHPATPPPPRHVGACGDRDNPCPLQKWMRQNMAPAVAANDTQALAKALDRAAAFSPDASWQWSEIAKTAAEFARQGDMSAARKSCRGCHDQYKNAWKSSYRTRPIR